MREGLILAERWFVRTYINCVIAVLFCRVYEGCSLR